jgi:hypothetical protein
MSDELMEKILRSPVWTRWSASHENYHSVFALVAALCSSAKRPALREALSRIDSHRHILPILQFFDILDSLEKVSPQ